MNAFIFSFEKNQSNNCLLDKKSGKRFVGNAIVHQYSILQNGLNIRVYWLEALLRDRLTCTVLSIFRDD